MNTAVPDFAQSVTRVMGPVTTIPQVKVAKPSKYDGTRDALKVEARIFDVETKIFQEIVRAWGESRESERRAVQVASTYLEGSALVWWLNHEGRNTLVGVTSSIASVPTLSHLTT